MSVKRVPSLIFAALALVLFSSASLAARPRTDGTYPQALPSSSGGVNPINPAFLVSNIATLAEVYPVVAYNSIRYEYLAVWYNDRAANDDIMAQFFAKNGSLIGNPFYIATGGATIERRSPQVAYDVKADQYLVVWEQQETSSGAAIYGCRVTGNHVVLDTAPFVIRDYGIINYTPATPVVAYAYTSDKYLVVWSEVWHPLPITDNIYGQLVLSNGTLSGNIINIAQVDGSHTQDKPDLAYNLARDEYLVVWQQLDPGPTLTDIWARRVSGGGAAQGAGPFVVAGYTKSTTAPSVAALPVPPDGQYLVIWEQNYKANDRDIMGRRIIGDGTIPPGDISISVTDNLDEFQPDVTASPTRGQFLVTWIQINIPLLSFIYARLVPATGDPQTASFFLGGLTAGYPRLAAGWNGDFALVYHDINFSFDWGSYGWLIGNRQYLPFVKK